MATKKDAAPWIIEVKGHGAGPQAQGNYFLAILGQILQRMSDPSAKYSIAMPDLPRFRGLWERLPEGAKARTGITVLFVRADGTVAELQPGKKREILSLDEIANLADATRRRLLRLLDWVDGKPALKVEKGPERISRLVEEQKIPKQTANCMRFVMTFRNVVVYVRSDPTLLEIAAWRAAWDAILEWAKAKGWSG